MSTYGLPLWKKDGIPLTVISAGQLGRVARAALSWGWGLQRALPSHLSPGPLTEVQGFPARKAVSKGDLALSDSGNVSVIQGHHTVQGKVQTSKPDTELRQGGSAWTWQRCSHCVCVVAQWPQRGIQRSSSEKVIDWTGFKPILSRRDAGLLFMPDLESNSWSSLQTSQED